MARATGLPVVVDGDANLAALAEAHLGAGAGYRVVLLVALGTGIGGGLVVEGRVERGRAFLGEIGHMVMDPAGPLCACGRHGCWEALVSGTSLARAARRLAEGDPAGAVARAAAGATPRGEHLSAAAREGDAAAAAALADAGEWLGRGLANLVAVLDPDVIVVGGAAAAAGEALLGPARATLSRDGRRGGVPCAHAGGRRPVRQPRRTGGSGPGGGGGEMVNAGRTLVGAALVAVGAVYLLDVAGVIEARRGDRAVVAGAVRGAGPAAGLRRAALQRGGLGADRGRAAAAGGDHRGCSGRPPGR